MADAEYDVCVVGGGPAGAVAAFRLATIGHRVCLVEKERFPRPHVGESLSPGIWPSLDWVGLRDVVLQAGFRPPGETLLSWATAQPERIPADTKSRGLLVDRGVFDALLLLAARQAGVDVIQPATARVTRVSHGWQINAIGPSPVQISAGFLIDACGRRGCLPGRRTPFSPPTLAIWTRLPLGNVNVTRVEAIEGGWLWAAPVSSRHVSLILICGSESLRGPRSSLERYMRENLARTQLFSADAQAPFLCNPRVCDATCAYADEPIGPTSVKIGEASFSPDPLSSTGVEKAMQSALVGTVVANTIRRYPDRASLCIRYYSERQREAVATHSAWNQDYYCNVIRYAEEPFWASRRGGAPSFTLSKAPPAQLGSPPLGARFRIGPQVSITNEPCLSGDVIEARPGVRGPMLQRPLVFLDGAELASLLVDLQGDPTWPDLLARWSQHIAPARAERIALWLWQRGILCEAEQKRSRLARNSSNS